MLGLFARAPHRPTPVAIETFATTGYDGLVSMIREFLARQPEGEPAIDAACIGVAGPVLDDTAELTNVPWMVDGRAVALAFGLGRVRLLNDLVSVAHSVSVLHPDELLVLQEGTPNLKGNAALLAAGTGMGQSFLFNDGRHLVPAPSEAGHSDFPPRTPREWQYVQWLTARFGRAEGGVRGVGHGRLNHLYHFVHGGHPCVALDADSAPDLPRVASEKAPRRQLRSVRGGDGPVRRRLCGRGRQPRLAHRGHARRLHRRRHRAEEPAPADTPGVSRTLPPEGRPCRT